MHTVPVQVPAHVAVRLEENHAHRHAAVPGDADVGLPGFSGGVGIIDNHAAALRQRCARERVAFSLRVCVCMCMCMSMCVLLRVRVNAKTVCVSTGVCKV